MHGDFIYFIHISAQIYSIRAGMYDLLENSRQCLCSFLTSADVPVYHPPEYDRLHKMLCSHTVCTLISHVLFFYEECIHKKT
jgi:hypothetical protein